MSVKRQATTQLTHDNWDEEDPPEQETMGAFKVAAKEVLEKRVIKTARRRTQVPGGEVKKSVFSNFGFNKEPPPSFDFLSNLTNGSKTGLPAKTDATVTSSLFSTKPPMNVSSSRAFTAQLLTTPPKPTFGFTTSQSSPFANSNTQLPMFNTSKADSTVSDSPFKMPTVPISSSDTNKDLSKTITSSTAATTSSLFTPATSKSLFSSPTTSNFIKPNPVSSTTTTTLPSIIETVSKSTTNTSSTSISDADPQRQKTFYAKLKRLNICVLEWIQKNVEEHPLCLLTPIFKDYEKHLKAIKEELLITDKNKDKSGDVCNGNNETKNPEGSSKKSKTDTGSSIFQPVSSTPKSSLAPIVSASASMDTPKGFKFGINNSPSTKSNVTPVFSSNSPTPGLFTTQSKQTTPKDFQKSAMDIKNPTTTGFSFGINNPTITTIASSPLNVNNSSTATSSRNAEVKNVQLSPKTTSNTGLGAVNAANSSPKSSLFSTQINTTNSTETPKGFKFGIDNASKAKTDVSPSIFNSSPSATSLFGSHSKSALSKEVPKSSSGVGNTSTPTGFSFGISTSNTPTTTTTNKNIEFKKPEASPRAKPDAVPNVFNSAASPKSSLFASQSNVSSSAEASKGFKFGIDTSPKVQSGNSPIFNANQSPSGLFSVQNKQTAESPKATLEVRNPPLGVPSGGFSFGMNNSSTTSTYSFGFKSSPPSTATGLTFGTNRSNTISTTSTVSPIASTIPTTTTGYSFDTKVFTTTIPTPTTISGITFNSNTSFGTTTANIFSATNTSPFSFAMAGSNQIKPTNPSPFSMTMPTTTTAGSAPFSFGFAKPFSFSSNIQQQKTESTEEKDDDEPPKVEFTPVVEENSVYDKRCKVFVKRDNNFVDKGVGTLYIKKVEETGKYQLLVRADTNLGNILLNLILSSSIPSQRMGKNNVMLICIPTPDAKPPPCTVLIRVKTAEEADELLASLEKYKK